MEDGSRSAPVVHQRCRSLACTGWSLTASGHTGDLLDRASLLADSPVSANGTPEDLPRSTFGPIGCTLGSMESHLLVEAACWLSRRIVCPKRCYHKLARDPRKANHVLDQSPPNALPAVMLRNGQPSYPVDGWLG